MEQKTFAARVYAGTMYVFMHVCIPKVCSMCICRYVRRHQPLYARKASDRLEVLPKRIAQELQWIFVNRDNSS